MFKIAVWLLLINHLRFFVAQRSFPSLSCIQKRNPKIVGGLEAHKNEMPFIVSLMRRGGHFCGGTIINERWLLTAGHCICNGLNNFIRPSQIKGAIGIHSISEYLNNFDNTQQGWQVQFKSIVPHPGYQCTRVINDIALLEFTKPIQFANHMHHICLTLDTGENDYENNLATVSGWGWTNENQEVGQRSDVLRKATVKIWNNGICERSYQAKGKRKHFITETQMCAGYENGGIDSCWADSGGPLITKENVLIGVVSTGIGCARPGLPGIYTRVSKYLKWMESVILTN